MSENTKKIDFNIVNDEILKIKNETIKKNNILQKIFIEIEEIKKQFKEIQNNEINLKPETKKTLIFLLDLYNKITDLERSMNSLIFKDFYEWIEWFHLLENIRKVFRDIYNFYFPNDFKDETMLDTIVEIQDGGMKYFDISQIKESDKKQNKINTSDLEWYVITADILNNNPQAWVTFNNVNEIIEYFEKKWNFKFKN